MICMEPPSASRSGFRNGPFAAGRFYFIRGSGVFLSADAEKRREYTRIERAPEKEVYGKSSKDPRRYAKSRGGNLAGDRPVSCVLRERENPATLPFEGPQLGYSITRSKATSWLATG